MSAILHQEAQPPSAVAPATWSPAFDRIVLHCLEKDVSARFQSARDLAFALESVATLAAAPLEERSRSRPNVWRRVPVWWLALVAAAGVGAASLTGGVKSVFVQQHRDEAPTFSRVTRLAADGGQPVLAPDRQWVAYLASALGRPDVYVKYLSGGQTVNLTANERQVSVAILPEIGTLDVSPDGTLIAFGGGPQGAVSSELSTYVISAPLGGAPRKLVDRGLAVRWSPDGRHITYMKPGGAAGDSLWVADANGEHARLILEQSVHAHWPAWSADGRFIYYNRAVNSGNREPVEVFRVPVEGGKPERVIATSRRAMYPSPSLDGRGLLYCSNPVGVEMVLWWKPVDGDPIRVTTGIGEYAESRLSRDGRSIVATVGIQRRQSLISMAVSGNRSAVMPITSGESGDFDATVSPKGDRIALSSARSGDRNIWTVDLNGANGRPVTAGSAVDERPAWSPDGRRIAFVSSRGGRSSIWATDVDGGAPTHVADAQVLDTIAWSPDGTQLVYAMNVGASSALFLVPAEGGTPRRLHTPGRATAPTWSAAANMIAYIEHHPSTRSQPMSTLVAFVTPNGDIPRPPLSGGTELSYATIAWSPDGRAIAGAGSVGGVGVPPSVWLLPLEGPARRLVNPPGRPRGITWTADGKHVIVSLAAAPDEHPSSEVVLFEQGH
jgi:TolB protein